MKQAERYLCVLGLALMVLAAFWAGQPQGRPVLAQVLRPTPTNEGESPPTLVPTETTAPPTETPIPAQPANPPRQEPASPQHESSNPAQASGQGTVPRTGLLSPGTWGALAAAVALVGVVFGARYLRHREKESET